MAATAPQRILVVRNDRLGDTVLTLPAIAAVKEAFPRATCAVLVESGLLELLQHVPIADLWLSDDVAGGSGQLARLVRRHQFDTALVINTNTRNTFAVWQAGIPRRVTWAGKPLGRLLGNCRVDVRRSHPPIHESDFAIKFVERLVGRPVARPTLPRPSFPPPLQAAVAMRLARWRSAGRPCCLVHPGNRGSAFNWPVYRYAELVRELDRFATVLVSGGPGEEGLVRRVTELAGDRGIPVVGWSLPEFAALVGQVDGLVVSSTGPMHLAGWLGTPVVALFSRHPVHSPQKWSPLGNRHTIIQPRLAGQSEPRLSTAPEQMERIDVETVLRAVLRHVVAPAGDDVA